MAESSWYAKLRAEYRPERVRLLLIGESAPDPGAAERRFFYAPILDRRDNLFRGVVEALYGHRFPAGTAGTSKVPWLDRLRADGVFLIDLVPFPADKLSLDKAQARRLRAAARRDHRRACVELARALDPSGVIVCHVPTFDVLSEPLREAELPILHFEGLPFPLGNTRARFVAGVRTALARLDALDDAS